MAWRGSNRGTATLSKSILEMKFMKRTKDKVEKQALQEEGEEFFGKQNLSTKVGSFGTVTSFAVCEGLIEGRLSFGGENPELERLLELENMEKTSKNEPSKNETDVSDVEMANRWRSTTKINITNMQNKKHPRSDRDSSIGPTLKKAKYINRHN